MTPGKAHPQPRTEPVLRASGEPLDAKVRARVDPRLGHDFGSVRVHSGETAARSAQALGARAYTVGRHIVLGAESPRGGPLLEHELVHAAQQRFAEPPGGDLPVASPSDATEREASAVASGAQAAPRLTAPVHVARQPVEPATAPQPEPRAAERQAAERQAAGERAEGLSQIERERPDFAADMARQRVLKASKALGDRVRELRGKPEDERKPLQATAYALQQELAQALRESVVTLEKYITELRSRRRAGERVGGQIAELRRELAENKSDLDRMSGIFSPARHEAFEKVYEKEMPGMFCMVRAYAGIGALFSQSEADDLEKKVATKAAKSKKRGGPNIDHFITVMQTARAERMAGPKLTSKWRKKSRRWDPSLQSLVDARVHPDVPGYWFFGLALAEAFHSVIVGVSTWEETPRMLWCDQYGCTQVTGTLDEHALAVLEGWSTGPDPSLTYTDWDTYLWKIVPPAP